MDLAVVDYLVAVDQLADLVGVCMVLEGPTMAVDYLGMGLDFVRVEIGVAVVVEGEVVLLLLDRD